ncbi:MAG: peptide deformylase, partial [Clostridia bacterium]|nr:peptide deformylase [Clostridia bacterium]
MVKEIVRDALFLAQKSEPAKREDRQTALDLLDTLRFNSDRCVGMAANMIGVRKRIIAVDIGMMHMAMLNPVIVRRSGAYETEEG